MRQADPPSFNFVIHFFLETGIRVTSIHLRGVISVLVTRERFSRILALTLGLFVLSQMWAQMVMEIQFPLALKLGPVTAVLFLQ